MTFDEFKGLFDEVDARPKLMNQDKESPLVRLSRFSRENPSLYESYRQRMKRENERRYSGPKLPWE